MLWSGGGFSYRSIFRLTNKFEYLETSSFTLVRPICRSTLGLVAQGNFRWQNPFSACKIPAFPRSLIDFINLWHPKSSSLQIPLETMEIISAVFAGMVIREGFGKLVRHEHAWRYKEGVRNCARDGGGPLGAGLQEQAPNHLKLRW
jgi:hypothetical protein